MTRFVYSFSYILLPLLVVSSDLTVACHLIHFPGKYIGVGAIFHSICIVLGKTPEGNGHSCLEKILTDGGLGRLQLRGRYVGQTELISISLRVEKAKGNPLRVLPGES